MTHILLVEDDPDLARGLAFNLEREGFQVTSVAEGGAALEHAREQAPDVILLDLGLPDMDGTEVLRTLRKEGVAVPVVCLTARGTETDQVMGLDLGADDYVTKPFGLSVLLARVHAVLRRAGVEERGELLQLGELRVDLAARTATWPDRVEELTPVEVDILRHFCARRGVALDRGAVLKDLWGLDGRVTTRTLDNHVARLRRKIEPDPAHPRWLVTVHGVGYRLEV